MNIALQITANLTMSVNHFYLSQWRNYAAGINFNELKWSKAGNSGLLSPGHPINKPGLLFEKIEDEAITRQIDKLLATKKQMNQPVQKQFREKRP